MARKTGRTIDQIQEWVKDTFEKAVTKHGDEPAGVYVMCFVKTKRGNIGSPGLNYAFKMTDIGDALSHRDIILALDDESFKTRFRIMQEAQKRTKK